MAYVDSEGHVVDQRSVWRLSIIPEFFRGIITFIMLFFTTMFQPGKTKYGDTHTTDYRPGPGPQGGPRRRFGGIRHGGGPAAPPMAGGG